MPESLNVRRLIAQQAGTAQGSASFCFDERDFLGFKTVGPVLLFWQARPLNTALRLDISIEAALEGSCVRCLNTFRRQELVFKTYDIEPKDLLGEFAEYPIDKDGLLDLEELSYGELVIEVSPIFVCKEDCPGLCPLCGKVKNTCQCQSPAAKDPRWQALNALLKEG